MASFVRKNVIVCSTTFTANDGSGTQPLNAQATLVYTNSQGQTQTDVVPLLQGADGVWSGAWDSSNAAEGSVAWLINSTGGLVAATQGSFFIKANAANTN